MQLAQLDHYILQSKTDEVLREQMIQHHKSYIINTVGHICKRFITWNDDESSIGLSAFNRAIDTYDPHGGRTFLNYAFLLVQRDLINFFEKNKTNHLITLPVSEDIMTATIQDWHSSMDAYEKKLQRDNMIEEILELDEALSHFGILFEELEDASPKHLDTRISLHEKIYQFMQFEDLREELLAKKRFPMSHFIRRTGYPIKTLEKYRKYIITIIIICLHPEWVHLSSFIRIDSGKGGRK